MSKTIGDFPKDRLRMETLIPLTPGPFPNAAKGFLLAKTVIVAVGRKPSGLSPTAFTGRLAPFRFKILNRSGIAPRSGITLLFVVSLIVLFLLMGTAFVVLSSDFFRSARVRAHHEIHMLDPDAFLDKAFYDLLREPDLDDANSPLRAHSILGDMYGYGFKAHIRSAELHSSQQFLLIRLDLSNARFVLDQSAVTPPKVTEWGGLVVSLTTGPAQGISARIVDHQVTDAMEQVLLLQIDSRGIQVPSADLNQLVGSEVLINGRPFSGTGAGRLDLSLPADRPALTNGMQTNQKGRTRLQLIENYLSRVDASGNPTTNHAATNESYDTFDYQNVFLAGLRPNGSVETSSFFNSDYLGELRADFRAITGPNQGVLVDNLNHGAPNGVWMDIGLPSLSNGAGVLFKPLVSYTVIDMDGRANLNAHGNLFADDQQMTTISLLPTPGIGTPDSESLPRGIGYGPPEISLNPLLGNAAWVMTGNGSLPGRYSLDGQPGAPGVRDEWSQYKMFGYPNRGFSESTPGTVSLEFGSAMDVHGRFAIGYPDSVRDENVPVHLPVVDVGVSNLATELVDSAYELSFAEQTAGPVSKNDTPFTVQELEGVLRRFDRDSQLLPDRLRTLGQSNFAGPNSAQFSITTASFEVPTLFDNLPRKLASMLEDRGISGNELRTQVSQLLPPDILRGLPMNMNRPFGDGVDNNGDGVVDDPLETNTITHPDPNVQPLDFVEPLARQDFARHLYVVALLATEKETSLPPTDEILEYRKLIAQWAVNVVDFRDRDSVMTGVVFDLDPWDGWDVSPFPHVTAMQNGRDPRYRFVAWGVERPELLISEVAATHDRRTQDLRMDREGKLVGDADPDEDFDSHFVPNVSVFFELYNPWVMNDANQHRPPELCDGALNGVDLQKTANDGSPVWRLAVARPYPQNREPDPNDPSQNMVYERRIYFTETSIDQGPEVYYPDSSIRVPALAPGLYAVVGSAGVKQNSEHTTYFGRKLVADPVSAQELMITRQISLNPTDREIKTVFWNYEENRMETDRRPVLNIPIGVNDGLPRNLGLSDPLRGYQGLDEGGVPVRLSPVPDGHRFTVDEPDPETAFAFDTPVDKMIDEPHYNEFLKNDGMRPVYRIVYLQRLANPLAPYHPLSNPYLTIDSSSVDLNVFNGLQVIEDPQNEPEDMRFGSYERESIINERGSSTQANIDERRHRLLFKNSHAGTLFVDGNNLVNIPRDDQVDKPIGADLHSFSHNFKESLGMINQGYRNAVPPGADPIQSPFGWLTWNNRPYASHLETVNVPFRSSYWLTRKFDRGDEAKDVYAGPNQAPGPDDFAGHYPHLFNFYSDQLDEERLAGGLHRVLDFLEVPSRFIGTESYVNPIVFQNSHDVSFSLKAPFDSISNYRYPGKLNINTVLDSRVWQGLMGNYSEPLLGGTGVSYDDWEQTRNGNNQSRIRFSDPLKSSLAANWVPRSALVREPSRCGLFRSDENARGTMPLFDYQSTALHCQTERAPYFRNAMRQRLGNLVTGRSSVFAVWITVAYFEVNADGSIKNADDGGIELGHDSGTVSRHRAFYMVDRSIPVAFEPGKNHNVDRAVLIRSRIE